MKAKAYRQLCKMNEGFAQVRRSLRTLAKYSPLETAELRRFEKMAAEACAATNSYILETFGAKETDAAGRLFAERKARERQEEHG